jgi:hypothetical protein
MHKDLTHFKILIPRNLDKNDKEKTNKAMGVLYDFAFDYVDNLARSLKIPRSFAWKIYLLRGGDSYSEENEKKLIEELKMKEREIQPVSKES